VGGGEPTGEVLGDVIAAEADDREVLGHGDAEFPARAQRAEGEQVVGALRGTGEEAGAWETSTPYESLLVTISQAVRGGKLPAGWYQVPVTKETLQAPAGLSSVADAVWTGNHLKMVRFAVENKTLSALNIRESDFWQPGTRAVMFSQPASQLLAGARMDVYVIRDGEGN